ncbi:long-chain-fatty-acid--coa ligase 5 [Anaeramoeba ignava]|uniref:Long-chain-fatty-acid--coa ligase 5 n=1 Tax=Anaeramoeba ignava TaxID=1746090 RepID=A0A9Q0LG07_ANAIG|nr:long-chain-fatty-acid--coa ligase 5 [Anaeramoeba ignava]
MGQTESTNKLNRVKGYIPEKYPRLIEEKDGKVSYSIKYEENGETMYRSHMAKDGLIGNWNNSVQTLYENLEATTKTFPDHQLFGTRKYDKKTQKYTDYEWKTFKEFNEERTYFGSGLINYKLKKDDRIGVFAKNRYEWVLAEHAAYAYSFLLVPLYHTFGIPNTRYIINDSEIKTIITEAKYLPKLSQISKDCPTLESIILLNDPENELEEIMKDNKDIESLKSDNIKIFLFDEILESGKKKQHTHQPSKPDDLCSLIYTSGTTSQPKGVCYTHKNMVGTITGFYYMGYPFSDNESYYSYLPLSHVFERSLINSMIALGSRVGFFSGDNTRLLDELQLVKPTIFIGVPRIFAKVYDSIKAGIKKKGIFAQYLFNVAYEAKKKAIENGESYELWDKLVFNKTKQLLGGKIGILISGSAALLPLHQEFFKVIIDPHFVQGWGLTETGSGGTVQIYEDTRNIGLVGPPLCCNDIKLVSVPELNYSVNDFPNPRGELAVKGPNVFEGYYNKKEATDEVMIDGWFHTGDIAEALPNGYFKIVDRKKNIFKLSQGEYIAPDVLEGIYSNSSFVMQIMVYGNSSENYLIGVVVPEKAILLSHFNDERKENEDDDSFFSRICQDPKLKKLILDDMERLGRRENRFGFEIVRNFIVEPNPFSVENEMMTTTMKLRRKAIEQNYKKQLQDLYSQGFEN